MYFDTDMVRDWTMYTVELSESSTVYDGIEELPKSSIIDGEMGDWVNPAELG